MQLSMAVLFFLGASTSWHSSFAPDNAASYFPNNPIKAVVVGAGEPAATAGAAADAFAAALEHSGQNVLLREATLGTVSGLTDPEIIKKSAPFPVDYVAVVRVFGSPPTAVITIYGKNGEVVTAASVAQGTKLAPVQDTGNDAGLGVSETLTASVTHATSKQGSVENAQAKYDEQYIWFKDLSAVALNSGEIVAEWTIPYRGKYKKRLEGAEFYNAIGREDLASQYEQRRYLQLGFQIGGSAVSLVGLYLSLSSLGGQSEFCSGNTGDYAACRKREDDRIASAGRKRKLGYGIMVGGLVGTLVAAFIDPHPVDGPEARRLAEEHNKKLKKSLGLASRERSVPDAKSAPLRWAVAPVMGSDYQGASFALRF